MSTARWTLEPRLRLCPSQPARAPLSGVERRVRLSSTAAVGCSARPAAARSTARRSCAAASKQPALSQRIACWCTAAHGGRSLGMARHGMPWRTT